MLVEDGSAERESDMHTLYGNSTSGNCWKPAVMLHARGLPFRWIEVDILKGESRTPEFLKRNPNGRVPLLVLPDGRTLAESNAMLLHLGEGTAWLPTRSRTFAPRRTSGSSSSSTATSRTSPRVRLLGEARRQGARRRRRRLSSAPRGATQRSG